MSRGKVQGMTESSLRAAMSHGIFCAAPQSALPSENRPRLNIIAERRPNILEGVSRMSSDYSVLHTSAKAPLAGRRAVAASAYAEPTQTKSSP